MSDREVITLLLRNVEWRIRANRLLQEFTLGLSIVLTLLIALKIWDLFSPFQGLTITLAVAACVLAFAGFAIWRIRQTGTLDQAAFSIDQKAGLHDEIKTAFWFLNHPRSSEWVDRQIERAARNARHIDVKRTYPNAIPRTSYIVAATILLFIGLNFVPMPANHNWLMLQAAPKNAADGKPLSADPLAEAGRARIDKDEILEGLEAIAQQLQESDLLKDVADALQEGDLKRAADELRALKEQLAKASQPETDKAREALLAAAAEKKAGLEDVLEEFTETADALENNDDIVVDEELEETAQELEELVKKMENSPPGSGFQSDKPTEAPGESGSPTPNTGQIPQKRSNTNGPGASKNPPPGGLAQLPKTSLETQLELDVKLQAEVLKGLEGERTQKPAEDEEEVAEASKQERSKLDYRDVKSELTPAQKDLLNQDHVPWEYRALIKSYFQGIRPPTKPPIKK
jgi:hypothetical protein